MTLPVDIILDLHQDGLRVHVHTGKADGALRLTGPYGEALSVPFTQLAPLRAWLEAQPDACELRITGDDGAEASIPARQLALLHDWLGLALHVVRQRQQGPRPVTPGLTLAF